MTGRSWMLLVSAILFTLCMVLGLLSIGIMLLPATALAFIAFVFSRKDRGVQDGLGAPRQHAVVQVHDAAAEPLGVHQLQRHPDVRRAGPAFRHRSAPA